MITLNTSVSNSNYKYQRKYNPSFKSAMPQKSAFLNPVKNCFQGITKKIATYYYGPLISSKIARGLFHSENIGNTVNHMQAIGSYVISGMYMLQTLRNKDMDEDRRKTLAINQGLTLLASTAIAYLVSERLVGPWNKHVTMKYIANKRGVSVEQLEKEFKQHQKVTKETYFKKHADEITLQSVNVKKMKKNYLKNHKSLNNFDKYLNDLIEKKSTELELTKFKDPGLVHFAENGLKNSSLAGKIKGLDVLKSLIIFGSVYRFFGPVAVTPVATWLGNKLTGTNKKTTPLQEQKAQEAIDTGKENIHKDFDSVLKRTTMASFLSKS